MNDYKTQDSNVLEQCWQKLEIYMQDIIMVLVNEYRNWNCTVTNCTYYKFSFYRLHWKLE